MDYDRIRQQYLLENKSQRQIAKELGISRNTVAKYCKGGAYPGHRAKLAIPISNGRYLEPLRGFVLTPAYSRSSKPSLYLRPPMAALLFFRLTSRICRFLLVLRCNA